MAQYIDKEALLNWAKETYLCENASMIRKICYKQLVEHLDTIEVKDPYELWIQYPSVKDAIQAHAETYSFNIESLLFNQLTKEQQKLWRKEIEQACISGGEAGLELARDIHYKENLEVKELDLKKELSYENYAGFFKEHPNFPDNWGFDEAWIFAKYFFELGLKAQKGE